MDMVGLAELTGPEEDGRKPNRTVASELPKPIFRCILGASGRKGKRR